jgi:hypothetical protein
MHRLLFYTFLAGGCLMSAHAQKFEIGGTAGYPRLSKKPLGSSSQESKQDTDTTLKATALFGGRFTINTAGYYGHELFYWRSNGTLTSINRVTTNRVQTATTYTDKIRIQNAGYNFLVYFMPNGERWRPFITGGVHAQQYDEPNFDFWTRGRSRNYGFNYGAGIKLIPVKHTLIRFDFRHYLGGKPYDLEFEEFGKTGGLLGTLEGSVGFAITF